MMARYSIGIGFEVHRCPQAEERTVGAKNSLGLLKATVPRFGVTTHSSYLSSLHAISLNQNGTHE